MSDEKNREEAGAVPSRAVQFPDAAEAEETKATEAADMAAEKRKVEETAPPSDEEDDPDEDDLDEDDPDEDASVEEAEAASGAPLAAGPSFVFMAVVASLVLLADAVTKYWAETTLSLLPPHQPNIVLIEDVLNFHLAYNKGGAFGMLSSEDDSWRGPFFLLISFAAVAFIVSLYRRVAEKQWALKWGLPLVLGGALGNLADRISKGQVVDFIDYKAGWVKLMNETINSLNPDWHITSHWPTFNVADMCICAGVALMAIDMFTSSRQAVGETTPNDAKAAES